MKITNNNDAVSPVLGILLMVVVTLIMATVVTAVAFGVGGTLDRCEETANNVFFDTSNSNDVEDEPIYYNGERMYNRTQCNGNEECEHLFN